MPNVLPIPVNPVPWESPEPANLGAAPSAAQEYHGWMGAPWRERTSDSCAQRNGHHESSVKPHTFRDPIDGVKRMTTEYVERLNQMHWRAMQDCPDLKHLTFRSVLHIRDGVAYDGDECPTAATDNERRCSICYDRARVPFDECWFCGQSPSWHHGRCCPDKPRTGTWFDWKPAQ